MTAIPEEQNEQCVECRQWGDIYWRSHFVMGNGLLPFRMCCACFGRYVALTPEASQKYRTDLQYKLFLELAQPGGCA